MAKKVTSENCLATNYPELIKEWHPTKNGDLTPWDVLPGSDRKVWWQCAKAGDHEWEANVYRRTSTSPSGCPCCSGHRIVLSNCLATKRPDIAEEWHPSKNGKLTPYDVSAGSNTQVWWLCSVNDAHEWMTKPGLRTTTLATGCPYCAGNKVLESDSLVYSHPEVARQWHPTKNTKITPFEVAAGSNKKVWWKCDVADDHEWQTTIVSRTAAGVGCPFCTNRKVTNSNCLETTHPDIASEWHHSKNGKKAPKDVLAGSHSKVWWQCGVAGDHEWQAAINKRVERNHGCPVCAGRKIVKSTCLATIAPEYAAQWHPTKNGDRTPLNTGAGYGRPVWWKCDAANDHEWRNSPISRRTNNSGCPCCSNNKVVPSNCLANVNPELAEEWHPSKNGDLTPYDVTQGAARKVWWQCRENPNHEWHATLDSRVRSKGDTGSGCPDCKSVISEESKLLLALIQEHYPDLISEVEGRSELLKVDGWRGYFDAFIPSLNVFLEYDGEYYHRDKQEVDLRKVKAAKAAGFKVIRVRQAPLKRLGSLDVVVPKRFDPERYAKIVLDALSNLA